MRKRLLNNLGLKIISLVLAFLLWFLVVQIGDPKDDRDMGNIQVKLINTELLEKESKVYEVLDNTDTVRVSVYAPKSVFTQLRASDITAEADVSKLTDINTVPITFRASNASGITITGSHDVVRLNVEEKISKYVTLMSSTAGTVADGYVISSLTPDQNRIEVSGPRSAVEQVKYAGAEIDVTDATTNLIANVDITLYDADGKPVERNNLAKNVDYVRMVVEVLAKKEVPVRIETSGTPGRGYMATGVVECDPSSVEIAGSVYTLSGISELLIPEEELDITGETADVVRIIDLRKYLPDNVKLADVSFGGRVTVTVYIEPVMEKSLEISMRDIAVANVPDTERVEVEISESAEDTVTLDVSGLRAQIEPLRQDNVTGVVDIGAWMERQNMERLRVGTYTVPITFLLDESIRIKNAPSVKISVRALPDS
ncbi:MAG: CdaR family protein [Muribaculum sp.]|nr:CdaR family protein [Muribaculum sp.]